ncbi:MAG: hypothetical protein JNL28_07205 [Planctomycetes bacterium]|nr:hypothetical protein [Planctomycetota bacterium]
MRASGSALLRGVALWWVVACGVGSAQAQMTPLWHYEGQVTGPNWRSVAIGASGSQVVSNPDGGSGAVALLSGSHLGASSPLIWADNTSASARAGWVRAAADTDAYASLYFEAVAGSSTLFAPKLTLWRSSSPVATWTKSYAAATAYSAGMLSGLHMARDGSRTLAWWYDAAQSKTYVVGYDIAGTLLFAVSMQTPAAPHASAADDRGRRLLLALPLYTIVLDGTTGALTQTLQGWYNPTSALVVDGPGDTAVIGNAVGGVNVYRAGTALYASAFAIPGVANLLPRNAALSADGSTLAVAFRSSANTNESFVRIYALGATGATQLHEYALVGVGAYTTIITDMAASRTGDVIVASTSGDQEHLLPSLLVFRRVGAGFATEATTLPGTAYDVDLSADGRILAVASSTVHFAVSTSSAYVDAYDLGGDLSVRGIPHAGSSVVVEQKAPAGLPCVLLVSDTLAPLPMNYGSMGTLLLQTPIRLAVATADGGGVAHFEFALPAAPSWYGHTYYTQGMALIQRRLTERAVPITVVP